MPPNALQMSIFLFVHVCVSREKETELEDVVLRLDLVLALFDSL